MKTSPVRSSFMVGIADCNPEALLSSASRAFNWAVKPSLGHASQRGKTVGISKPETLNMKAQQPLLARYHIDTVTQLHHLLHLPSSASAWSSSSIIFTVLTLGHKQLSISQNSSFTSPNGFMRLRSCFLAYCHRLIEGFPLGFRWAGGQRQGCLHGRNSEITEKKGVSRVSNCALKPRHLGPTPALLIMELGQRSIHQAWSPSLPLPDSPSNAVWLGVSCPAKWQKLCTQQTTRWNVICRFQNIPGATSLKATCQVKQ